MAPPLLAPALAVLAAAGLSAALGFALGARRRRRELGQLRDDLRTVELQLALERELAETLRKTVSHDFANPLMAIRSYLVLHETGKLPAEEWPRTAKKIAANVAAAQALVARGRVAAVARREAEVLGPEAVPVGDVLTEAAHRCADALREKDLRLELRCDLPDHVRVHANRRGLVEHVLPALLSNAAKYSQRGAVVTLAATLAPDGLAVVVAVTDPGVGMSREELERRPGPPRPGTEGESGAGMGLVLLGPFLGKFGGRLQLSSSGPGLGATASIELRRVID